MFIFIGLIMLVFVQGCETTEQSQNRMAQEQALQEWRQAHPVEAAQIDLMQAQEAYLDAQATETYGNMLKPRAYRAPGTPRSQCRMVSIDGVFHHVCP